MLEVEIIQFFSLICCILDHVVVLKYLNIQNMFVFSIIRSGDSQHYNKKGRSYIKYDNHNIIGNKKVNTCISDYNYCGIIKSEQSFK